MVRRKASRPVSVLSALALICLLCGVPVVLILSGGIPDPAGIVHVFLHPSGIFHDLSSPASNLTSLHLVMAVAWLGWLWFAVCVLAEVFAEVTHQPTSKIPGSRRMQSVVACLVGVSVGLLLLARTDTSAGTIRLHALQSADAVCLFQDGAGGHGVQDMQGRVTTGVQDTRSQDACSVRDAGGAQDLQNSQSGQDARVRHVPINSTHGGSLRVARGSVIAKLTSGTESQTTRSSGNRNGRKIAKIAVGYVSRTWSGRGGSLRTGDGTFTSPHDPIPEGQNGTVTNNFSNTEIDGDDHKDRFSTGSGSLLHLESGPTAEHVELAVHTQGAPDASLVSEPRIAYPAGDAPSVLSPGDETDLYTVQPGDSLWSIAVREFGSGTRWKEIALLNDGRLEPGGLVFGESKWLLPGWKIALPGRYDLVAGQGSRVHADVTVSATTTPGTAGSVTATIVPEQDRSNVTAPVAQPSREPAAPIVPSLPLGGVGIGTLGAGVLFAVDRRRLVQGRYRGAGREIKLPSGDLLDFERRLRISADADAIGWVRIGISVVASMAFKEHQQFCTPRALRLRPGMLDVAVDHHVEMASSLLEPVELNSATCGISPSRDTPFVGSMKLKWWALERSDSVRKRLVNDPWYGQVRDVDVAVVTLGSDAEGVIMVDLDALVSLSLNIEAGKCISLETALAVELATSPWLRNGRVVTIGLPEIAGLNGRIEEVESLPLLMPHLARRVSQSAKAQGVSSQDMAGRGAEGVRGADRTIVLVAPEEVVRYPESAIALASLAGDGSAGLLAVIGGVVPNAKSVLYRVPGDNLLALTIGDAAIVLQDIATLSGADGMNIKSLLEVAQDTEDCSMLDRDVAIYDNCLAGSAAGSADPEEAGGQCSVASSVNTSSCEVIPCKVEQSDEDAQAAGRTVEVCVLGQVEIHGAERAFARAWAVDLVAYLAMHPRGATSDQWAAALWPDKRLAASSLHSTASAARRALGKSPDGLDYLPRSHGRLALRSTVHSDVHRLVELSKSSYPASWRVGLELVRGRPFEGLRSTDWALLEGIYAYVESKVVDLAVKYAEHCLGAGDAPGAEWAARKGLLVSTYDERLYRILMRSADLAGNPAGVERVMRELVHLVADDLEPYDAVHPETIELYRSLSRHQSLLAMA
ncbi:MAG: LysM peptidoglycan-binding domain-containing protein [Actinobacteria bacterium]|nr:LysM peptidoglycan-binding domain-containing protein [Actinomycetota bacterium]MCL5447248.1 LysM peptidoglycan-binding domain-containing protein [Actinomycetota bacterium]